MILRSVHWLLLGLALWSRPVGAQPLPLAEFDRYVARAMRVARVPGVAVAIVQGDSVLLAKGWGVRRLDRPGLVDTSTVFAIGSATKSFTATALAMLVDEGRLAWNDRVAERLPGFLLADPYVSREVTVRDLLSHRTGLPRCDIWYGAALMREEVVRRMRFCPQATPFRAGFGYQNVMFLAAGQLIPALTGRSWDDFVAARILTPLGMTNTTTTIRRIIGDNVATPHAEVDGRVMPVPWRNLDNVAPAGALNSTIADLTRWLRFLNRRGMASTGRLLAAERLIELWAPVTPMTPGDFPQWASTRFLSYGLGWFVWEHRNHLVVEHSGGIDGMSADVALLPELGLGIAVLANLSEAPLTGALVNWLVDAISGVAPTDWVGELTRIQDAEDAVARTAWNTRSRVSGTAPTHPVAAYAGRYADSLAGPAEVRALNGRLVLVLPERRVELGLAHWHYNSFVATWPEYRLFGSRSMVTFQIGPAGQVESLTVEGVGRFGRLPGLGGQQPDQLFE